MFVEENSANIYLQGMRDRSMRSGTKFAQEIQLTDWSTAGNLSNRSSGVQIPRDICTRFGRYLYSTRCSWIIKVIIIVLERKLLLITRQLLILDVRALFFNYLFRQSGNPCMTVFLT